MQTSEPLFQCFCSEAGIILWVWVFCGSHMLDASEQGLESLAGIVKLEYKTCKPEWDLLHKNTYAFFFQPALV